MNLPVLHNGHETPPVDGLVVKPNQLGTITEAHYALHFAKRHGMFAVPFARSGGVGGDVVMD
ncbi:Enolase [Pandoraea terrigena]|uniref:Enolase n=1 Tax=Pandoraea terrigena TaxID=2508292 RepID=A0A5E4WNZ0_9BURK|nr:Enolase [Pandoraea terrigena]